MAANAALEDNYAGAFGGKAGFGQRPALILIDFVEAYFAPDSPSMPGSRPRLHRRCGYARPLGWQACR
ncbi:hypothetical protein ACFSLT_21515 [Novosphingobium resinovorum]